MTLTGTVTKKTATQTYRANIASAVGGTRAWVGFTADTGGLSATQDILSWPFSTTG